MIINADDLADAGKSLPPVRLTKFVSFLTFITAIGGFLFGYDTGVISGAGLFVTEEFRLNYVQVELVVGATTLGAIIGGLSAGFCSDRLGRRPTIFAASLTFLAGSLMMALAYSYGLLMAGRIVVGIGVGIASMVVPTYISEIAPKELRGRLVTINVLMITGGQLISYLVAAAFASTPNGGWRWMFGIGGIPAVIQLVAIPFMPESPRYLQLQGRTQQARHVLGRIYGTMEQSDSLVDEELRLIDNSIRESREASFFEVFAREHRLALLIACGLQALQQLSGFNTVMYYGATLIRMAGFRDASSATKFAITIAATNMLMTMVALFLIDRIGRRRLLLTTVFGMFASLVAMGIAFFLLLGVTPEQATCEAYLANCGACLLDTRCYFSPTANGNGVCLSKPDAFPSSMTLGMECEGSRTNGWFALVSLILFVATYATGIGNIPWLIQSELFGGRVRGAAAGVATSVNWTSNLIISSTFLSLTHALSPAGTFWLYGVIAAFGWLFVYRLVPETRGRSLEEIREQLAPSRGKSVQ